MQLTTANAAIQFFTTASLHTIYFEYKAVTQFETTQVLICIVAKVGPLGRAKADEIGPDATKRDASQFMVHYLRILSPPNLVRGVCVQGV